MSLLWATKISPCLFCIETFHVQCQLFKSNSSTRGTLHFTRQPRSCEVAPTLRQFHFQTSVSSIIVLDVLKMIVCQWSQMNGISRLMGISEQQKIVFVQFVPVFAHKYNKSSKIHYVNRCFTGHQVTLLKRSSCYRASWGNQSCLCRANARIYQVQVLIILSWRWSQCHAMSK